MRLPLQLAIPHTDTAHTLPSLGAPPIIVNQDTGELLLIELQGALELSLNDDDDHDDGDIATNGQQRHAGQTIGKLDLTVPSRPTLMVGHHRLIGQLVKLSVPIAVLRHTLPKRLDSDSTSSAVRDSAAYTLDAPPRLLGQGLASSPLGHHHTSHAHTHTNGDRIGKVQMDSSSLKRAREDGGEEQQDVENDARPTKRTDGARDGAHSQSTANGLTSTDTLNTPLPPRLLPTTHQAHTTAITTSSPPLPLHPGQAPPSSAMTARTAPPPATPLNVSELKKGKHEIVAILRQKILFSKRPEPVVSLEESSDDEDEQEEERLERGAGKT